MKYLFKIRAFHAAFAVVACLVLAAPMSSRAAALRKMSVDDIAKAADVIVVGQVQEKESRWVDRRIETTVKVAASEYWKGDLGSSFEITQMGGEVTKPLPIAMHAGGSSRFYPGERVVLFLRKPAKSVTGRKYSGESRLPGSYKIVGLAQGKYTIIKDQETGEDKALRLGLSNLQVVDKREMAAKIKFIEDREKAKTKLRASGGDKAVSEKPSPEIKKAILQKNSGNDTKKVNAMDPFQFSKKDLEALGIKKAGSLDDLKSKISESLN